MEDRISEKKQNEFKKEEVIIWLENAWDEDKEVVDYIQISNKYSQLNIQNTARSDDFFLAFAPITSSPSTPPSPALGYTVKAYAMVHFMCKFSEASFQLSGQTPVNMFSVGVFRCD